MHINTKDTTEHEALLRLWNSAHIQLSDMQHSLLIQQGTKMVSENASFIFLRCKDCAVQLGNMAFKVKGGTLFHAGRGQVFNVPAAKYEVELYQASYQAQLAQSAGVALSSLLASGGPLDLTLHILPKQTAFFEQQFRIMQDEYSAKSALSVLKIKSCLYAVAQLFFKELSLSSPVQLDSFEQARQYMQQHFREQISIQALAESLGISRSHLYNQFKAAIEQSPKEYLMSLRLKSACTQLIKGEQSLDQIAVNCGLGDKGYLSRVFKRYYNMSPGEYRQRNTNKESALNLQFKEPCGKDTPLTIENFGRLHSFSSVPKRVVCLDYASAELCLALGAGDALVAVADADEMLADCKPEYGNYLEKISHLFAMSGYRNVPTLADIVAYKPELVIGTSYSFEAVSGVAEAAAFERRGIHIYAMTATCKLESSLKDTYLDIWNLAQVLKKEECGKKLINKMQRSAEALKEQIKKISEPVRVFSFAGTIDGKPLSCGQSLENHLIELAGGKNIFSHCRQQLAIVDWETVARENPQVILVHRFSDKTEEQCLSFIMDIPLLRYTDAVRNRRIHPVGLKKIFPAIDNVKTAWYLAYLFHPCAFKNKYITDIKHSCI